MWTQAHRATYRQSGAALPSDLTDAQWERLEPLIPAAKSGGRPRHDGHARGDERNLLSPTHGLSLAVSAARPVSSALDGLQYPAIALGFCPPIWPGATLPVS
jgi:transposase